MARKKKKIKSRPSSKSSTNPGGQADPGNRKDSPVGSSSSTSIDNGSQESLLGIILGTITLALAFSSPLTAEGTPEQLLNWIPLILWFLVGAGTCGWKLFYGRSALKFSTVDFFVYGVCLFVCLSGLVSLFAETGHARPTINSIWQWFGFAVVFFVIRQFSESESFRRAAILAMISIAIGCSVAAVYQRYFVFPEVWTSYQQLSEEQKQEAMRQGGLSNVASGTRERVMWENRLYATSPTSTFVLTNSLAVFLTPWSVVIAAWIFWLMIRRNWSYSILMLAGGIAVLIGLLLTKSRTSYLAAGLGIVSVLAVVSYLGGNRLTRKTGMILFLGMVLLGVVAFVADIVDVEVFSEAFKSFKYRLEYWQASWSLIQDRWLMGCGPGNFQHAFAGYQLVEASETVSDPHNFLIEVWAIAGTPAAIFLVCGIFFWMKGFVAAVLDSRQSKNECLDSPSLDQPFSEQIRLPFIAIIGTVLALFVALLNELNLGLVAISGLIGILFCLGTMQLEKILSERITLGIGLIALVLGLSASGGIGFPSVAISGILLIALTVNTVESSARKKDSAENESDGSAHDIAEVSGTLNSVDHLGLSKWIYTGMIVLFLAAAFGLRVTVVDPIRIAQQQSLVAEREAMNGNLERALKRVELAIDADPHDGNYLFFKFQLLFNQYQSRPHSSLLDNMEQVARKSVTARPNNSKVCLEIGKMFLSLVLNLEQIDENERNRIRELTVEFISLATDRRPNDALHTAYRAFAYAATGDSAQARKWAIQALELNERNPHRDKDLENQSFQIRGFSPSADIEQEMQKIRNQ